MSNDLTHERLTELLDYQSETGFFFWRKTNSNRAVAGSRARCLDSDGYVRISIDCRRYRAHRLAWFYVYESWPDGEIDHIDHDRENNRISNLRVVSHVENSRNQKLSRKNTSGFAGVSWHKGTGKWVARIGVNGRLISSPVLRDKRTAILTRRVLQRYYGFSRGHGEPLAEVEE